MVDAVPRFADLSKILSLLEGDPRHAGLAKAVRRAAVVSSCLSDLSQASHSLHALAGIVSSPRRIGTPERAATESALMTQAILLYGRATHTNGQMGERGSISIHDRLTAEQRDDHDTLIAARNRAIAHVYSDEVHDNEVWHQQQVIVMELEAGWLPLGYTKRVQLHKSLTERLRRQIPVAASLIRKTWEKRCLELVDAMNKDQVSIDLFHAANVDPVELFGSVDEARRVAGGRKHGHLHGFSR